MEDLEREHSRHLSNQRSQAPKISRKSDEAQVNPETEKLQDRWYSRERGCSAGLDERER